MQEAVGSLRENRIDPKFLYVTPRQTELWRQVFLKHSPIHANPEFARIYRDAFARTSALFKNRKIVLVGLGCGTGLKELELYTTLAANGSEILFSAIDVSRDLVEESAGKLIRAGAGHRRSLVSDLGRSDYLQSWLDDWGNDLPRIVTFFGLVPNFSPSSVKRILRAVLRPGDVLLASAHLAPVQSEREEEISTAMKVLLPQYDNPETIAWLNAAVQAWDLERQVESPKIGIGEMEGIPAFLGSAKWKTAEPFEKWGHRFSPDREEPLRLFFSLRYTPVRFENILRREGFDMDLLSITPCRQEAIWCIRCA